VMDLQVRPCTAGLTTPAVAAEYLLSQVGVRCGIQAKRVTI
jgi:hypothetical protein